MQAVGDALEEVAAGQAGDEGVGRVGGQLVRLAGLVQAAVEDDADAVGERAGVEEVVGDDQRGDRDPGEDVGELFANGRSRVGVERRQRLVEQQHGRVAGERAGDGHPLALAAGQAPGLLPREM